MFATCSWLWCSKSRKISERFLTKWHGDIATRGASRTFGEGLGRSTVAHFARKVRGANIAAAKHELKIQRRYAPERWLYSLHVRGPHFASKVSYNAGAATDDYAGPQTYPLSQPLFFPTPKNKKSGYAHVGAWRSRIIYDCLSKRALRCIGNGKRGGLSVGDE